MKLNHLTKGRGREFLKTLGIYTDKHVPSLELSGATTWKVYEDVLSITLVQRRNGSVSLFELRLPCCLLTSY